MSRGRGREPRGAARRVASAAVLLALFAGSARASAQGQAPRRASLTYTRAAGAERCPDAVVLGELVAARLGYAAFDERADLSLSVVMTGAGRALEARIELRDAPRARQGRRSLTSTDTTCRELAEAVALALALAIDPRAAAGARSDGAVPAPPPPGGDAAPAPRPSPVAPPPRAPVVAPRSGARRERPGVAGPLRDRAAPPAGGSPLELRVGLGGLVALGSEPSVTAGGLVLVGLAAPRLSGWVELRTDLASSSSREDGTGVEATLSAASLVGCYHLGPAALCGLGTLGVLRGHGLGVAAPRDDASVHAALGVRSALSLHVAGPLSVGAFADVALTLTPTTLRLDGQARWTTPPVAGALGAMAEMAIAP